MLRGVKLSGASVAPYHRIVAGVAGTRLLMVNVFGIQSSTGWLLVDAGLPGTAGRILRWACDQFGGRPPHAILLTHGHFDHVGALHTLQKTWNCPVYAHGEELDYITGRRCYPPPDPTVGGGLMARLSWMMPRRPIDLKGAARELPPHGVVPSLPDWNWIHTPGHSAGHVSFFRPLDRTVIAGDAVCTTKQESAIAVFRQTLEMHGPPAYFTTDWDAAFESLRRLAALDPSVLACGHGRPVRGPEAAGALRELVTHFDKAALPVRGRYVAHPVHG